MAGDTLQCSTAPIHVAVTFSGAVRVLPERVPWRWVVLRAGHLEGLPGEARLLPHRPLTRVQVRGLRVLSQQSGL